VDPKKRRRGTELDAALLEAAWAELVERGYAEFTLDGVAERAHTSRPVLARRWPGRPELVLAAIRHESDRTRVPMPDTGTLRGDVLALLRRGNQTRQAFAAMISVQLSGFFQETGRTLADLRLEMLGDRVHTTEVIMTRAIERGEVDGARITPRMVTLAFDLLRHELLMTQQAVSEETILEIVDDIFLPVVMRSPAR
jgi:AcrR family transcriptional regulator